MCLYFYLFFRLDKWQSIQQHGGLAVRITGPNETINHHLQAGSILQQGSYRTACVLDKKVELTNRVISCECRSDAVTGMSLSWATHCWTLLSCTTIILSPHLPWPSNLGLCKVHNQHFVPVRDAVSAPKEANCEGETMNHQVFYALAGNAHWESRQIAVLFTWTWTSALKLTG